MTGGYTTAARLRQHHLTSNVVDMDEGIRAKLLEGVSVILDAADALAAVAPKAANIIKREINNFMCVATPEHRIRCVSQITGALREPGFYEQRDKQECVVLLERLELHFVFPLLLHSSVRYLHRALATLVRTVYVMNEDMEARFQQAFVAAHLDPWDQEGASSTLLRQYNAAEPLLLKNRVMMWVNCIDSTVCVAAPLFPAMFGRTFLRVVPLLGDSLRWMVDNACVGCSQAETGKVHDGVLLGEDLSYVRYGIRVVTTYVHKFLHLLGGALLDGEQQRVAEVQEDICKLLSPSLKMLSLGLFPKDVLNGAGLLVSSLLTIRTCDASFLLEVCRYCGTTESCGNVHIGTTEGDDSYGERWTREHMMEFTRLVCSENPRKEVLQRTSSLEALHKIFSSLTRNGRFALMKGLLAHLSTPLRGNVNSIGVLLKPVAPLSADSKHSSGDAKSLVALYDIIIPTAVSYCSALHIPDTRFMAIQTIDSAIRHLSSVFSCIASLLEAPPDGKATKDVTQPVKRGAQRVGGIELLAEADRQALCGLCSNTSRLTQALSDATEVIMGMWDDSTQHVAGPLYGAYSEILTVHSAVKRCTAFLSRNSSTMSSHVDVLDIAETLHAIISTPNERRGKYHALLALLDVVQVPQFIEELRRYYGNREVGLTSDRRALVTREDISEVDALREFTRMLLHGAVNPKVGSASGEVFAKTAACVRLSKGTETETERLFTEGVIDPLVELIALPGHSASVCIEDAARISRIVTHMIAPCLRQHETYLSALVRRLEALSIGEDNSCRVFQSIVEILHRARSAGRDISVYMHPGSLSFKAVLSSLQSQSSELRYTALGLCVLSIKKAEPVLYWQCRLMELYVSTNVHYGGDLVAMRNLLEVYKKWTQRLIDSCANQRSKQRRKVEDNGKIDHYEQLVMDHCMRTMSYIAPHIGQSVEWCRNLSLERRVTAMMIYLRLVQSFMEMSAEKQQHDLGAWLFPEELVDGLLECLSSGWVKARNCAFSVLELYCRYVPGTVFSQNRLGDPAALSDANTELVYARTYKKAEGGVLKYILAKYFTPEARKAASEDPSAERERRIEFVRLQIAALHSKFIGLCHLGAREAYDFVKVNSFHGPLSLCATLLSNAKDAFNSTEGMQGACNELLLCCSQALQNCTLLVGGESGGHTNEGQVGVDCRGHAFDRDTSCEESSMRTVVNNAWLCIRAAAVAIERVANFTSLDSLSFEVIRELCYVLVESLLRTKHNGVMRALREALKAVAAALLGSRDATYHTLPSEILEFLLGPDGVTSINAARMLRRSQGLPHALLAVLEAEDPGVPPILFPRAMKKLLQVATVARGKEPQTLKTNDEVCRSHRSNALNVLKFIFENKLFASRSISHLEDAFWIAAAGFDDPSWGIRNSSLMLFSAVLPRFVGEHPSTGGVGVNTTLHDIAVRTPRAVAFAYEELVKSYTSGSPSLGVFPLLQMLSMLAPDPPHLITKATAAAAEEMEKEQPDSLRVMKAVIMCGSSRSLMIRSACSVALTSLVPPETIEGLFAEFRSVLSSTQTGVNALHGVLLHIQQFHTFYVGTLRHHMKPRALNSSATPAVRQLVSRLAVETLVGSEIISEHSLPLLRICTHCPTIAATFFTLSSDALYYATCGGSGAGKEGITESVFFLMSAGIFVFRSILCATTPLYDFSRGYHAAVVDSATLFAVLTVQHLPDSAISNEAHATLWVALCDIFARDTSGLVASHAANHISQLLARNLWAREVATVVSQKLAVRVKCDLAHTALAMLRDKLIEQCARCISVSELFCIRSQLEFAVAMRGEGFLNPGVNNELFTTVENLLLECLDPNSDRALCNADIESWSIRFLALRCFSRVEPADVLLRILSYYSMSTVSVQTRAAVVDALGSALSTGMGGNLFDATPSNVSPGGRCAYLLILLRLLFDDAYDVRTAVCFVVSRIASVSSTPLDHVSCVISLVCLLRSYRKSGELTMTMVAEFLLKNTEHQLYHSAPRVACVEGDDEISDDEEVLFEKEADNMFAEGLLFAFLADLITEKGSGDVPDFLSYTELAHIAERCGNSTLTYGALVDDTLSGGG